MEAGEKEMREIFEETTRRNVNSVVEHSNKTRELARDLEERIVRLEKIINSQNQIIETLRTQLAAIQTIVFRGGTV